MLPLKLSLRIFLMIGLIAFFSCSSEEYNICDSGSAIMLDYESCLEFEDNDQLSNEKDAIEQVISETLDLVNTVMPIDKLSIKVRISQANAIPEIGIGGFNPNENEIILSIDQTFNDLSSSIDNELGPMLAHEIHHAKRRREVGYGSTLLEAMVSEGMADCFSVELFGIDPPIWSVALSETELDEMLELAKETWTDNPYNHDKWFFGTTTQVPRWAGYSIGFKLVKDFIANNQNKKASILFDEAASSFAE